MFKMRTFWNDETYFDDTHEAYWVESGAYETYDKALIACYEEAIRQTLRLAKDSTPSEWVEINTDFEVTGKHRTEILKNVTSFPVAIIRCDKAPYDKNRRDYDYETEIVLGFTVVEV